jgi:hypothetical protein
MADPRWLDPALDRNDRVAGRCYLGDPAAVNNGPIGLARFSTLRSWLSQWSIDESHANTEKQGAGVTVPALVVANGADDACPPSHTDAIFGILCGPNQHHTIKVSNQYYIGQSEQLSEAMELCIGWMQRNKLLGSLPDRA